MTQFLSKARTLISLKDKLKNWKIPYSYFFTIHDWKKNKKQILSLISDNFDHEIIVRSSSINEDKENKSNAGKFLSIDNIKNNTKIVEHAINKVIISYKSKNKKNEILIQNYISDSEESGVIFTSDQESGQPYIKVNYSNEKKDTRSVTSGKKNTNLIIYYNGPLKSKLKKNIEINKKILDGINELSDIYKIHSLDIEYILNSKNILYLLQVRKLITNNKNTYNNNLISNQISKEIDKYKRLIKKKKNLIGNSTFFSNMTDWNPAEMLGKYPKNLSVDIYKYLITDSNWSKQRADYGYQNITGKLLKIFCGQPYIDIRLSINSFIPANLNNKVKKNLFSTYYNLIKENTNLHDKLEFEVVFTIWTVAFKKQINKRLSKYGLNKKYIKEFELSLKAITREALIRLDSDINPIKKLIINRKKIIFTNENSIVKFFNLLNDCKKNGIIPFAHSARAAFVSIEILKGFVMTGDLTIKRYRKFLSSIQTISNEIERDLYLYSNNKLQLSKFLKDYGHLRPGTYEIENFSYSEKPNIYFKKIKGKKMLKNKPFVFTKKEKLAFKKFLKMINSNLSEEELINFFYSSIKKRELIKFEFTKNISIGFDLLIDFFNNKKIKRDDLSYINLNNLLNFKNSSINNLKKKIIKNKTEYKKNASILLPSILKNDHDFICFKHDENLPNFVTDKKVVGNLIYINTDIKKLNYNQINNKIVLIENADPGYDWIFAYKIKALVTKFGGANSHMAIRAYEKNLPSAIGAGEKIFKDLENKHIIKIDCLNKKILIIE